MGQLVTMLDPILHQLSAARNGTALQNNQMTKNKNMKRKKLKTGSPHKVCFVIDETHIQFGLCQIDNRRNVSWSPNRVLPFTMQIWPHLSKEDNGIPQWANTFWGEIWSKGKLMGKKNQWCNLPIEGDGCQSGRTGYRYLKSINKKEN